MAPVQERGVWGEWLDLSGFSKEQAQLKQGHTAGVQLTAPALSSVLKHNIFIGAPTQQPSNEEP